MMEDEIDAAWAERDHELNPRWCYIAFCGRPAAPHTNVCAECEADLLASE